MNLPHTRIYVHRGFVMYAVAMMVGDGWIYVTIFGACVVRDEDE
jgi:hypothetical protein